MRKTLLFSLVMIGLVACTPGTNSPTPSPMYTNTLSPTNTLSETKEYQPSPTVPATATSTTVKNLTTTKNEIVDFMIAYIVENEIEEMIDIIDKENVPLIDKPPDHFIVILSPISQPIDEDYSKLQDALDTKNAEKVWIYKNGELVSQTDGQTAIQDYQAFIKNAPQYPSIFMWGYNEFGIVSISDDGKEAKVYLASTCGSLCGHGIILFLEKNKDNKWQLKDMTPLWQS